MGPIGGTGPELTGWTCRLSETGRRTSAIGSTTSETALGIVSSMVVISIAPYCLIEDRLFTESL